MRAPSAVPINYPCFSPVAAMCAVLFYQGRLAKVIHEGLCLFSGGLQHFPKTQRCEWRQLLASVTPLGLRSPWAAPRSPAPCKALSGQFLCEEGTLSTQRQWPVAKNRSDAGSGCCDSGHHLEGQVTLESRTVSQGLTFRS